MKKINARLWYAFMALGTMILAASFFTACGGGSGGGGGEVDLQNLVITVPDGETGIILVGSTLQLGVKYTPENTTKIGVTWESSNPSAATVSNGLVTAVAPGAAVITATSTKKPSVKNTLNITVTTEVTGITLNASTLTLAQYGTTGSLTATIQPSGASSPVTWTSSDDTKVTVSTTVPGSRIATLTPIGPTEPDNPVIITAATANGKEATCEVTVNPFVEIESIALDRSTLSVMTSELLTVTITPANATNQTVTWTSADPTKATVPGTGLTVRVRAVSVTTTPVAITATATKRDGTSVTAKCDVSVLPFSGVTVFGWDADTDTDLDDIPWEGTRTINGKTARNFATWSSNDGSLGDATTGIMKAVKADDKVQGDQPNDVEHKMTRAGYWLKEATTPCLQIGSDAYTRTSASSLGKVRAGSGTEADPYTYEADAVGELDLSRAYKITVEYTGISTGTGAGGILVAALNNTGSVNTTNSPLRDRSGQQPQDLIVADGTLKTHVWIFDPTELDYYDDIKAFLQKGFVIVRSTVAASQLVVHSVKVEVKED